MNLNWIGIAGRLPWPSTKEIHQCIVDGIPQRAFDIDYDPAKLVQQTEFDPQFAEMRPLD